MKVINVMVKPASGRCNLCCEYCFYADEMKSRSVSDCGMMPDDVYCALIDKVLGEKPDVLSFLFQGGEPALMGLEFYRRFAAQVKQRASSTVTVQYAIQTNGTLLNRAWCRFFAENQFLVGLSLDGDRECHDRFRRNRAGEGTFDQVIHAASLLEEAGVEYNILTVVTGHLAAHTQSVFAFLCRHGFRYQQYIPCIDPLKHIRGREPYSLSPGQYEHFLKTLFNLWYNELMRGRYWSVRYFDNLVWMLKGGEPAQCSMLGRCAVHYMVEADGSVYPCDFYGLDEYRLGNILEDSWAALDAGRERLRFVEDSLRKPEECMACRWLSLCRNGCRRDRLEVCGEMGKNYYCSAYQAFFPYALPRLLQVSAMLP